MVSLEGGAKPLRHKYYDKMVLGIDTTNLSSGGGMTHLKEILSQYEIHNKYFKKIIIWGSSTTLSKLPNKSYFKKKTHSFLNKGLFFRALWFTLFSKQEFTLEKIGILFNPGGGYTGNFKPFVTMSRNMLVFEQTERARYGWTWMRLRLKILELLQSRSLKKAYAVIFISHYAKQYIQNKLKTINTSTVLHHGVSSRFKKLKKLSVSCIRSEKQEKTFELLYISIVDVYKHQVNLVKAIKILKEKGYLINLTLIGGAYQPSLDKLKEEMKGAESFVRYLGLQPYDEIEKMYHAADLFVFASTCENMPNILIEAMSSMLPVVCSSYGPMPEFLKDAGIYIDPLNVVSISDGIEQMILDPNLRKECAEKAYHNAQQYDWKKCAEETFSFLSEVALKYKNECAA
jgi:glycosyltransferase involved in cell wall biosynthesis